MATGYSGSSGRHGSSSRARRADDDDDDDHRSLPRSNNQHTSKASSKPTYVRSNSIDPETMTLDLVNDFKTVVQSKVQDGVQMTESNVESEVAKIRCNTNPDQCNFEQWKKNLPSDVKNCSSSVLRTSMAYGNSPREVKSVIQTKMNSADSNEDPTDTSLDTITDPLKRLKRELDKGKSPNLFTSVRSFDDRHLDRANRLFFSEVSHFARGLKDYAYTDAENAVQAIRETDYEADDPSVLLAITKTCKGTDDIRAYLQNQNSSKTTQRKKSPINQSNSSDDSPPPTPPIKSLTPKRNPNNNDTSSFYIKPTVDPNPSKPSMGTSRRSENISQDELTRNPPKDRPSRK